YRRLIDFELWRERRRVMILDADVLVNRGAGELTEWVRNGHCPFLLGQPGVPLGDAPPGPHDHLQLHFYYRVPQLSELLHLEPSFAQGTTSGFCGYTTELSLDRVEDALDGALRLGLPMEQWGGEQCLVIYLLSTAGAQRLPSDRYFNFDPAVASRA